LLFAVIILRLVGRSTEEKDSFYQKLLSLTAKSSLS